MPMRLAWQAHAHGISVLMDLLNFHGTPILEFNLSLLDKTGIIGTARATLRYRALAPFPHFAVKSTLRVSVQIFRFLKRLYLENDKSQSSNSSSIEFLVVELWGVVEESFSIRAFLPEILSRVCPCLRASVRPCVILFPYIAPQLGVGSRRFQG